MTTLGAFDGFLSYSHTPDRAIAVSLCAALQRFGTPWYRRRSLRLFRDEAVLGAPANLPAELRAALEASRFLVLLASKEAAASEWVRRELDHWLGLDGRSARVIVAISSGSIAWSGYDFDWTATDALPRSIAGRFAAEPLWIDLRWARDASSLTRDARWRQAVAQIASAIRGVPLDELIGEDLRHQRIARATAVAATGTIVALAATGTYLLRDARQSDSRATKLEEYKKKQDDIDRVLPQRALELQRVSSQPIRHITVAITAPELETSDVIVELRWQLDPLFLGPMDFYFTRYREGHTWPADLGFEEPSYRLFGYHVPRIAAKRKWLGAAEDIIPDLDGTELHEQPPTFEITLDGKMIDRVLPNVPNEVPALQKLIDDQSSFRLALFDRTTRQERELRSDDGDVDIRVTAEYETQGNGAIARFQNLVLYRSRHTEEEHVLLDSDYLRAIKNPIRREVLLDLYLDRDDKSESVRQRRVELQAEVDHNTYSSDHQRRLGALLLFQRGNISRLRGDVYGAALSYAHTYNTIRPLFDRNPNYEDGELAISAVTNYLNDLLSLQQYDTAQQFEDRPHEIAATLLKLYPNEPNYRRWSADADRTRAQIHVAIHKDALELLDAYIGGYRELYEGLSNQERLVDYCDALEKAVALATSSGIEAPPVDRWKETRAALRAKQACRLGSGAR